MVPLLFFLFLALVCVLFTELTTQQCFQSPPFDHPRQGQNMAYLVGVCPVWFPVRKVFFFLLSRIRLLVPSIRFSTQSTSSPPHFPSRRFLNAQVYLRILIQSPATFLALPHEGPSPRLIIPRRFYLGPSLPKWRVVFSFLESSLVKIRVLVSSLIRRTFPDLPPRLTRPVCPPVFSFLRKPT